MKKNYLFTIFSALCFLLSCKTQNTKESDYNYLQNIEQLATDASLRNNAETSTLQKGDQLVILITAKDMDVVRPFNQNYSSSEAIQNSQPGGNLASAGQVVSGPTYIIDANGDVDFPVVGKINTTGKSLLDFKEELREEMRRYVINPTVTVRITNFKVSVLGEVNRPGDYIIPSGQGNLLNALSLAGDLTMYGKRNDVLVIRNVDNEITKERINLADANFINSPFFNLKQGDVIYVSSNETREKTSKLDPKTGVYISIASVALGLAGIFITLFKK